MAGRRGPDRIYPPAFKVAAVERMETCRNITAVSRELGVQRELLYLWRAKYRADGPAGLRARGRPKQVAAPAVAKPRERGPEAAARIAELERKIGQQALELDFFRAALQHFGRRPPREDDGSETNSTP